MGSYWAERDRQYLEECYFCGLKHPNSEVTIGRWEVYGGVRVSENWWVFLASKFDNLRMYFWCCRWCLPVAMEHKKAATGPFDYGMPQWYIDQAKDYA